MKPHLFTCFLFLCYAIGTKGQVLKINCIDPKVLVFPVETEQLNEEVHYEHHKGFAFWYHLQPTSNGELSYQLEAINGSGNYEVKLYAYDGANFCAQLVKERITPISSSSSYTWKVKKGNDYYLGIDDLGDQCGHELRFTFKEIENTLRASLLGGPCMNKGVYAHPTDDAVAKLDDAIVGGLSVKGEVKSRLTGQAVDADMNFKSSGEEEHVVKGFSYRLKGYEVHLKPQQLYQLHVEALGYQPFDTTLTIYENKELVLFLQPLEKGGKFVMDNIYFYPNTFAYKDESEAALNALTQYMLQHKKVRIEIQGHTNGNKDVRRSKETEQSGAAWNYEGTAKELSRLRANVLRDYLVARGVSSKRIVTVGKGGDEMIVLNPKDMTEAARNIRVEIRILEN